MKVASWWPICLLLLLRITCVLALYANKTVEAKATVARAGDGRALRRYVYWPIADSDLVLKLYLIRVDLGMEAYIFLETAKQFASWQPPMERAVSFHWGGQAYGFTLEIDQSDRPLLWGDIFNIIRGLIDFENSQRTWFALTFVAIEPQRSLDAGEGVFGLEATSDATVTSRLRRGEKIQAGGEKIARLEGLVAD